MFKYRTGLKTAAEIEAAVDELLSVMTLEEKAGQLCQSVGADIVAIGSTTIREKVEDLVMQGAIGSMIQVDEPKTMARRIRRFQEIAVNESRLGIPLIFAQDVIHGYETVFPIPLAWACSFNMDLIEEATRISAQEASKCGLSMAFSPMLDIARDPRWGRVSEGAGEDPCLGEAVAAAQVRGYTSGGMLCCLKHFIGYGAAEAGRDYNTTEISDATLHNVYLRPFRAGIEAGAGSVMSAFNCFDGVPMTANKRLLKDVLRGQLGFDGIIISDYSAVMELMRHGVAADEREAALKAFEATLDIEMTDSYYRQYLPSLVREGVISEEAFDAAVRRVLRAKYQLGLMDDPFKFLDEDGIDAFVFCEENRKASLALAEESAVLLENNGVLPLNKKASVAVVGPFADSPDLCGSWSFSHVRDKTITIKQGLEEEGYVIRSAPGTSVFEEIDIPAAVSCAASCDIVVMALGEDSIISGEACSRQSITIPEIQLRLFDEVAKLGKPIVLVLLSGRPLLLDGLKTDAVLAAFALGSEAGRAIARLLSGRVNPSGHLSMSFPFSIGQVPVYYNALPTGRPYVPGSGEHFQSKWLDGPNEPLYPFGYGLSYSQFSLEGINVPANVSRGGEVRIDLDVVNDSAVDGKTLVQVYIRDRVASISRPVKELKAFKKVLVKAGGREHVYFCLSEKELGFYMPDGSWTVEDGDFDIFIGFSSRDEDLVKTTLRYGD